jgi:hypothetical protein
MVNTASVDENEEYIIANADGAYIMRFGIKRERIDYPSVYEAVAAANALNEQLTTRFWVVYATMFDGMRFAHVSRDRYAAILQKGK